LGAIKTKIKNKNKTCGKKQQPNLCSITAILAVAKGGNQLVRNFLK